MAHCSVHDLYQVFTLTVIDEIILYLMIKIHVFQFSISAST